MAKVKQDPFVIKVKGGKIKDRKLKSHHDLDDEEGFVMVDNQSGVSLRPVIDQSKLSLLIIFVLILFTMVGLRIFYLQTIKGDYYRDLAEGNRIRMVRIQPTRGIIFDSGGEQLVRNIANFSLYLIPADLPDQASQQRVISEEIAKIVNKDSQEIFNIIKANNVLSYLPMVLVDYLDYDQAVAIKIKSATWSGIEVVEGSRRQYLHGQAFSHILGYVGKISSEEYKQNKDGDYQLVDWIGKSGLEKFYEDILRGKVGKKSIEVNALGKESKILAQAEAVAGNNIYLYIDYALQTKLAAAMGRIMEKKKLNKGAAVIINPQNGGVLALVSMPQFDNNIFNTTLSIDEFTVLFEDINQPMFNRAMAGQYPSGSIIKPLLAAAALQEGVISERTTVNSVGGIYYDVWFFPDWKAGGHGQTNVVKAIAESVNTFFYLIGIEEYNGNEGLGLERMLLYMKKFNLGSRLGIDLNGEASGLLPDRHWKLKIKGEPWYPGDTMHLAIGQGDILVTPLQMANYIVAIANGGTLYRPQILKEKELVDGTRIISSPQIISEQIVDKENIDIVKRGMRAAVTSGSARLLNTGRYKAAAKTGTAQVGGDKRAHSWFIGFAPYDNPVLAWAVVIENGGEGSEAAVPIIGELLDWYFDQN